MAEMEIELPEHPKVLAYLACPYSHPDSEVRHYRYKVATLAAARLTRKGYGVFSPLTASHPVAHYGGLPEMSRYWVALGIKVIPICNIFIILTLDGWKESKGIQEEVEVAKEHNILVVYTEPKPEETGDGKGNQFGRESKA